MYDEIIAFNHTKMTGTILYVIASVAWKIKPLTFSNTLPFSGPSFWFWMDTRLKYLFWTYILLHRSILTSPSPTDDIITSPNK